MKVQVKPMHWLCSSCTQNMGWRFPKRDTGPPHYTV